MLTKPDQQTTPAPRNRWVGRYTARTRLSAINDARRMRPAARVRNPHWEWDEKEDRASRYKHKGGKTPANHLTPEPLVKACLKWLNLPRNASVLDAGSGHHKVWFSNLQDHCFRFECEYDDGGDFFKWARPVDWIVGNPPYQTVILRSFLAQALKVSRSGIAWLLNSDAYAQLWTQADKVWAAGFDFTRALPLVDPAGNWRGVYHFVVIEKKARGVVRELIDCNGQREILSFAKPRSIALRHQGSSEIETRKID